MADREAFLVEVRAKIARGADRPLPEYHPTRAPDSPWTTPRPDADQANALDGASRDTLAERFIAELTALKGYAVRVPTLDAARAYVLEVAGDRAARSLVRWADPLLAELAADDPLREVGVTVTVCAETLGDAERAAIAAADIGLSTAVGAIARTGSIILTSGPGRPRIVTLLPPTYIALVPVATLVADVPDALARFAPDAADGTLPASLTFHTGPSRSADIEQSLAIGVHGPGDVHVVLVG